MDEKIYEVAIGLIPGVGNMLTRQLVSYSGSAENVFKLKKSKLLSIPNIGGTLAEQIINQNVLKKAEEEIEKAKKNNVKLLFYTDKEYPVKLKSISDAPALLYYKGNTDLNFTKSVAIVGTRQATDYGRRITEEIVEGLGSLNVIIVSGLAYGIDIAAHKAALKYGLPTIGVMGSGIDIIYPAVHKPVAMQMVENGGILTENSFGTKPDAPRFPARNRIVAAITDTTIIVEAATGGGALITAEVANSYNKEVFAVPGNLHQKFSEGCNALIKNHKARIFTSVEDIIENMGWDMPMDKLTQKRGIPDDFSCFTEEEKLVAIALKQAGDLQIDELSWQTSLPMNKLASILLNMEFAGFVKSMPGKRYKLCS